MNWDIMRDDLYLAKAPAISHSRNQRTARFYNIAGCLYPLVEPWLSQHRRRLIHKINQQPPGELLEIGVGSGAHLPLYQGHHLTAIDLSSAMLRRASRVAATHHTNNIRLLLQADGEDLSLFADHTFNHVVICHVLAVTANPAQMISEALRVLRPGGQLYLLNHETPSHAWRHIDRLAAPLGRLAHLRTCFHLDEIAGWHTLQRIHEETCGLLGNYRMLILRKQP